MTFLILLFFYASVYSQNDWVEYVSIKNDGVMSVSIDLSLDLYKPNYKNLLVVGSKFSNCMKNGFPEENGLDEIFTFSDSIALSIEKLTPNRLAGFLTYQCMAFDVFYVKDTTGLRENLNKMIKGNFKGNQIYLDIKRDKSWKYYSDYLYPRNFSSENLIDHGYLNDLVLQGDDLQGLRKVEHWMYFKNLEKRKQFGEKIKKLKFSLESISYDRDDQFPYHLKASRKDSITPESIYKLTTMLRALSGSMGGVYDGWATEVRKKE
ncbi:DUF695 domain-containing protein [Lutimonas saemankumensis]|uniref:DUF695 domain-containing protein n=1 Tax=Lutimonas saemankumensis TaxID=483016 RepID=UPI001CD6AB2A|nr:DUF695 domain-containing protein [Lutimonas saemankumensis]MCA0933033.1 DUF695 domain-containing protein [Lutimonas saemankumensis]